MPAVKTIIGKLVIIFAHSIPAGRELCIRAEGICAVSLSKVGGSKVPGYPVRIQCFAVVADCKLWLFHQVVFRSRSVVN